MSQSLMQIYLHLVWSTKHRTPFLTDPLLRDEMHKYLGGACNAMECPVLKWGESRIISTFSVGLENPIQFHNDSANSNASRPNGQRNVIHHCEISIGRMVTERFP